MNSIHKKDKIDLDKLSLIQSQFGDECCELVMLGYMLKVELGDAPYPSHLFKQVFESVYNNISVLNNSWFIHVTTILIDYSISYLQNLVFCFGLDVPLGIEAWEIDMIISYITHKKGMTSLNKDLEKLSKILKTYELDYEDWLKNEGVNNEHTI